MTEEVSIQTDKDTQAEDLPHDWLIERLCRGIDVINIKLFQ